MKKLDAADIILLVIVGGVLIIICLIIALFALNSSPANQDNQTIRENLVTMIGTTLAALLTLAGTLVALKINKANKEKEKEDETTK
jgi:Ca2+/Na+ antiporter